MPSVQKRPQGQVVRLTSVSFHRREAHKEKDQDFYRRLSIWAAVVSSEGGPIQHGRPGQRIPHQPPLRRHEKQVQ